MQVSGAGRCQGGGAGRVAASGGIRQRCAAGKDAQGHEQSDSIALQQRLAAQTKVVQQRNSAAAQARTKLGTVGRRELQDMLELGSLISQASRVGLFLEH